MSDKAKPKVFSRRGFIKGIGSGVVGGYMVAPAIQRFPEKSLMKLKKKAQTKNPCL